MKKTFLIIIILTLSFLNKINSQDVEHLFDRFKQKPKISGGFSANQILYAIDGIDARRDPYTYFLNANLNLSIFGWNLPFSASYTNQKFDYSYATFKILPFNQYGISPNYKWVKLYLGYNSMTFSPYTMSGRTFYGVGVELTPGIFNFSAMFGKIQNAVDTDSVVTVPVYKRMTYALKFGVKKNSDFIDFVFFGALDDTNSINYRPLNSELSPMQNIVFNVNAGKSFFKKFSLQVEFASSAYTKDINKDTVNADIPFVYNYTDFWMPNNISTSYRKALKSNFSYSNENYTLGITYERVDPDYMSLGAFYFTNDFENLTINTSLKLFKNKVNLSANVGGQRNNLENDKLSQSSRLVGSINTSFSPSAKYNFSLNYSNFTSYTFVRNQFDDVTQQNPYQYLDTLNFTQLTQSANLNTSILLGDETDKNKRKSLNFNLNYQKASEKQNTANNNGGMGFYNGNASFMYNYVPMNLTSNVALMASYSGIQNNEIITLGPSLSVGKGFFENKLKSVFSAAYCTVLNNNKKNSEILTLRFNSSYILKKKHNFSLSIIVLNRFKTNQTTNPSFLEFTGTLNYSFNF